MIPFHERAAATEKTLAKYRRRPFNWSKRATCIHLARTQARNFNYDVPRLPDFRSAIGARTALRLAGFDSLEALLDFLFVRIPPARMLVGDLAMLPGDPEDEAGRFGSMMIYDGNSLLLGYHAADPSGIKPVARALGDVTGAWRL